MSDNPESKAKRPIIIKKRKAAHGGHHGGSWKVAYADFVTAMMAFFLLMWLLAVANPDTKAALATYFKEFSLFEQTGAGMMDQQTSSPVPTEQDAKILPAESPIGAGHKEELAKALKAEIESLLGDAKDRVVIDLFDRGVRIQVVDKAGDPVFSLGSTDLTQTGENLLGVVSESIKQLGNKISVEGHTDARPFASGVGSNWTLSTDRAVSAWEALEQEGIGEERMVRVAGYADTQLFIEDDPDDPRNRRISILVFEEEDADEEKAAINKGEGVHPIARQTPEAGENQTAGERGDLLEEAIEERYKQRVK